MTVEEARVIAIYAKETEYTSKGEETNGKKRNGENRIVDGIYIGCFHPEKEISHERGERSYSEIQRKQSSISKRKE